MVKLFYLVPTATYLSFDGQYCEQKEGVAMGSPLSAVIANFYMEHFECIVLARAPLKPTFLEGMLTISLFYGPMGKVLWLPFYYI